MKAGERWNYKKRCKQFEPRSCNRFIWSSAVKCFYKASSHGLLERFSVGKDDLNFASFDMEKDPLDMVIQEAHRCLFWRSAITVR